MEIIDWVGIDRPVLAVGICNNIKSVKYLWGIASYKGMEDYLCICCGSHKKVGRKFTEYFRYELFII